MIARLISALALVAAASPAALAQLNTTVGPDVVPLTGQLSITFSNDNPGAFGVSLNYLRVVDSTGTVVYSDTTFEQSVLMGPNGWVTWYYGLVDDNGLPLLPGRYTAFVKSDFGAPETKHRFEIVTIGAGLVFEGRPTIHPPFGGGATRNFYLQSPSDPGALYFLVGSFTGAVGYPTCNGTVPLDVDSLFLQTLTPGAVFSNSFGTLNALGRSKLPRFPLPPNPAFVGIKLRAAFVVLDPLSPCIITRISNAHVMTIEG
ncbi:MAG: hypothetical protein R3F34_07765 [Planctomycetota bacterium]